jgi:acetate kinase
VRRYGFHGLSYEYIASVLPQIAPDAAAGRTVVAHLGNGASMCAIVGGRSVASTMGFTAVDGLPMGTRCGNLDPGVILYLMAALKMERQAIEDLIYRESGLLGVSGVSSDMRVLLESDEPRARFAIDIYLYRISRELGSLSAAMQGIDALVLTAGVGENAVAIRERIVRDAAWLGLELDPVANQSGGPCISAASSKVPVWVIPANEELMIGQHTLAAIGTPSS